MNWRRAAAAYGWAPRSWRARRRGKVLAPAALSCLLWCASRVYRRWSPGDLTSKYIKLRAHSPRALHPAVDCPTGFCKGAASRGVRAGDRAWTYIHIHTHTHIPRDSGLDEHGDDADDSKHFRFFFFLRLYYYYLSCTLFARLTTSDTWCNTQSSSITFFFFWVEKYFKLNRKILTKRSFEIYCFIICPHLQRFPTCGCFSYKYNLLLFSLHLSSNYTIRYSCIYFIIT